jgi:hypothetical protein
VLLVFLFEFNEWLYYQFSMTFSYLDRRSNIYLVVSIPLDSIYIIYDTEILFASSTDSSSDIWIEWMTVVSILNDKFVSGEVD